MASIKLSVVVEIGKWLTRFFGLPFLAPDEVEDCFTDDIMSDAPDAEACMKFFDYILEEFVTPTSTFPSSILRHHHCPK
jgi:hypothetical protein